MLGFIANDIYQRLICLDDKKMQVHVYKEFIFSLLALEHRIHKQQIIIYHLSSYFKELLNKFIIMELLNMLKIVVPFGLSV